jgi:hypothetical protein
MTATALLAEGFEFFPIWCAEIPDLVGYAEGATSAIGGRLAEMSEMPEILRAPRGWRLAYH